MDNWQAYLYPNGVLKNKFNIHDLNTLIEEEYKLTHIKYIELLKEPKKGILDFNYYKNLHRIMFQDIYDWAGKNRTVDIRKDADSAFFVSFRDINKKGEMLFYSLQRSNYLEVYKDQNTFCYNLANFLNNLNRIHPFREGNGRSQKLLCEYLCLINGYSISFDKISPEKWNSAFRQGEYAFDDQLAKLLDEHLNKTPTKIQNFYRQTFGLKEIEVEKPINFKYDDFEL